MSYHYATETGEPGSNYALPSIEVFHDWYWHCEECGSYIPTHYDNSEPATGDNHCCLECNYRPLPDEALKPRRGWFSWFCLPGCLPDSYPIGPFDREYKALAAARDMAGLS